MTVLVLLSNTKTTQIIYTQILITKTLQKKRKVLIIFDDTVADMIDIIQ